MNHAEAIERLKQELGIVTHNTCPPIPDRRYDWCAVSENYDGAEDAGPQAQGFGTTEAGAVVEYIVDAMSRGGLL
jgi:ABC-type sugar transport system substrate-binding protein